MTTEAHKKMVVILTDILAALKELVELERHEPKPAEDAAMDYVSSVIREVKGK